MPALKYLYEFNTCTCSSVEGNQRSFLEYLHVSSVQYMYLVYSTFNNDQYGLKMSLLAIFKLLKNQICFVLHACNAFSTMTFTICSIFVRMAS